MIGVRTKLLSGSLDPLEESIPSPNAVTLTHDSTLLRPTTIIDHLAGKPFWSVFKLPMQAHVEEFMESNPHGYRTSEPPPHSFPELPRSLAFYDAHVDTQLELKQVSLLNLQDWFTAYAQKRLELSLKDSSSLPSSLEPTFPTPDMRQKVRGSSICPTAVQLSKHYPRQILRHCGTVASNLYFGPQLTEWRSVFSFPSVSSTLDYPFLIDNFGITIDSSDEAFGAWECLHEDVKMHIKRVQANCPAVAIYQIYDDSTIAEQLLKDMGSISTVPPANPEGKYVASGYRRTAISHGDIENSPIVRDLLSVGLKLGGGLPSTEKQKAKRPTRGRKKQPTLGPVTISAPANTRATYISKDELPLALIRRGWACAVASNSSFIVFHSGNFERVGIRDRESGTLYLSELIQINKQSHPAYHGTHTGFLLTVLQDAFERTDKPLKSAPKQKPVVTHGLKRRSRLSYVSELRKRNIALLAMQYDGLNSASPVVLTRFICDKPTNTSTVEEQFKPDQYFLLTLISEIARGATGVVHSAILELSINGTIREMRAIVKLAFTPKQCRRLRKELSIYDRLSSADVKGVPSVYGIFEGGTDGPLAMIMDHAGESILTLFPNLYQDDNPAVLPTHLRDQFTQVLSDIHKAGVLHHDIRPENLTVDNTGSVYIIDFDRARLDPTDDQKEEDLNFLELVLDGERAPGMVSSSKAPTSPAHPESDSNSDTTER